MLFGVFERLVNPLPDERPAAPPGRLIAFIWHYVKPFRWLLVSGVILSAVIAFIEVWAFDLVGQVVEWMGQTDRAAFWDSYGMSVVGIAVLIAIVWPLLSLLDELTLLQGIMGNMPMSIRWRAHRYLLRQSTSFYADDFAGRLSTKLMQTALGVRDTVVKIANLCVYITVYFSTALILFAQADWRLTIPLLIWIAGYAAIMIVFLPRLRRISEEQSEARSVLTGRIVDAYTNIATVKMFSSQGAEDAYAREGMEGMLATVYPQMRIATSLSFLIHLLNGILIAGTLLLGTQLWLSGNTTVGTIAFAVPLTLRIQGISQYFLWEIANLFENIGMAENGMQTLAQPLAVTDRSADLLRDGAKGIRYEKVTFSYGREQAVIRDLSLTIAPGEKVGLIGRSGAGKSTLVALALRFYDPEAGRILIGRQDVSEVTQDSLRRAIAVVSQDTSLLHRSIRDNIAYGREGATDDQVIDAARRAEAWDFIADLQDDKGRRGLDAMVGERGVKLSGGQRQRIAIARVILKDAPILILDEATSALDSEVEAAIQDRMEELTRGRTVLAIAHRLSTIAAMDRLVVMDRGRIIEQGTHAELLARGGLYAELWARQSGGFVARDEFAE